MPRATGMIIKRVNSRQPVNNYAVGYGPYKGKQAKAIAYKMNDMRWHRFVIKAGSKAHNMHAYAYQQKNDEQDVNGAFHVLKIINMRKASRL